MNRFIDTNYYAIKTNAFYSIIFIIGASMKVEKQSNKYQSGCSKWPKCRWLFESSFKVSRFGNR